MGNWGWHGDLELRPHCCLVGGGQCWGKSENGGKVKTNGERLLERLQMLSSWHCPPGCGLFAMGRHVSYQFCGFPQPHA